jgi:hypothetical protein
MTKYLGMSYGGLCRSTVSTKYITLIKDMYDNVVQVFEQVMGTLITL